MGVASLARRRLGGCSCGGSRSLGGGLCRGCTLCLLRLCGEGCEVWCEVRDGVVDLVDFVDGLVEVRVRGWCACFADLIRMLVVECW